MLAFFETQKSSTIPQSDQTKDHLRETYNYYPRYWDEYKNEEISDINTISNKRGIVNSERQVAENIAPVFSKDEASVSQKQFGRLTGHLSDVQFNTLKDQLGNMSSKLDTFHKRVNESSDHL